MTDKELLELAAKAAGISFRGYDDWYEDYSAYAEKTDANYRWNPLTDDGEALRLMAQLNINISYRENINGAWVVAEHENIEFCPESLDGPPEDVATRRAIVRAAAEIGRP